MARFNRTVFVLAIALACCCGQSFAQITYSGVQPGKAAVTLAKGGITLQNKVLRLSLLVNDGKIGIASFDDKQTQSHLRLSNAPLFEITQGDGAIISSNDFLLTGNPKIIITDYKKPGKEVQAILRNAKAGITVNWQAILTDGANFVTQIFTFQSAASVKISKITLVKLPSSAGLKQVGTVDGSPLVKGTMFFALEHPMSQASAIKAFTTVYLPRQEALKVGQPLTISAVFGVTPKGQLRRGFLYYTELARAQSYKQVLHYNSWFDLSWVDRKLSETDCLDRITVFTDSLVKKRHVKMDAFLFDDGWDDNQSLWQFNSGFPNGFSKLSAATKASGAALGVWVSPWGGYDEPKLQRLAFGIKQSPPFETNDNGFSLTGPVYNKRFRAVTTRFIKDYNVAMFKFDGVGAGNGANGASITYQKDIEAFLSLINGLREEKPNLYLSLTVGTWPSAYWLKYGDAIWRAGDDTGLAGDGPKRQQWITYKDGQAYQNIVKRAPLFPLNSLMYHGVCIAANGLPGKLEMDDKNIADEIWAFFGTGTGLQELYADPHKLSTNNWDCIKTAANWARANKKALADTHWFGGDPLKSQVYGYAGWAAGKGVLTIRNPTAQTQTFTVKVRDVLDLPSTSTDNYRFFDARDAKHPQVYAGRAIKITLAPYEVKVMDAKPF
ncbi:enterotoxin [Mucilaginibacter sp. ZT4R22]|uniref:Enterotoxin n=1 Tax=Mucilaginibacter pankratovii TaxID=2772110 RepID=A0ABR7WQA1_9SPHI|nr:enterotoxin [Mucilaginibacter pankratovii]MBD1364499.1 enterotoxin [Mucilaginibacter pankratovii]